MSPRFAVLWQDKDVVASGEGVKRIHHPDEGQLHHREDPSQLSLPLPVSQRLFMTLVAYLCTLPGCGHDALG